MEKHLNRFLPKVDIAQYLLNIPNKCTGSYRTIRAKGHVFHSIFQDFEPFSNTLIPNFLFALLSITTAKVQALPLPKKLISEHLWAAKDPLLLQRLKRLIHFQSSSMEQENLSTHKISNPAALLLFFYYE